MWEEICKGVAWLVEMLYLPIKDWGMAIIIMTILFRLIITPLMLAQTRSSFKMQKIQPLIRDLQERLANDPTKMQQEMQKLYADAKFNPLASCIPMLIQMPIFIALFTVLRNIPTYYPQYDTFTFYNLVPSLTMTPSEAFALGFGPFIPYLILIIIFVGATFVPMILQQKNADSKQRNQMLMMAAIMSIMFLFISWSSPAGVLLFWGVSGIIAMIIQQVYMSILRKRDAEQEAIIEAKPVVVEVERKVKKKRPTKKR